MEAVRTSETSVDNNFTRQYNPEDSSEHQSQIKLHIYEYKYSENNIEMYKYLKARSMFRVIYRIIGFKLPKLGVLLLFRFLSVNCVVVVAIDGLRVRLAVSTARQPNLCLEVVIAAKLSIVVFYTAFLHIITDVSE
jgi:hypothetical protein